MTSLGIKIYARTQKMFINTVATINTGLLLIITLSWPIISLVFGFLTVSGIFGIINYFILNVIRFFVATQFFFACSALKHRFKSLNDEFSSRYLNHSFEIKDIEKFTAIFHEICNCIDTMNRVITSQLLLLIPHILVSFLII